MRTELAAAIGSVTWTFREDTFRQKAGDAIDATVPDVIANAITVALEAIKSESSKVMGGNEMPKQECGFDCKAQDDLKELSKFQGKVLACLESINSSIREMKDNNRIDGKEIWDAVNGVREDIRKINDRMAEDMKALYWRVGYIAGGSALLISIVINLIASKVGAK